MRIDVVSRDATFTERECVTCHVFNVVGTRIIPSLRFDGNVSFVVVEIKNTIPGNHLEMLCSSRCYIISVIRVYSS